jgi:hypothetical protein
LQRFFRQLLAKICCRPRLEKLTELKYEDCYEKELSDAALAAATGAATSQNQGSDKQSMQFDERQLADMIGEQHGIAPHPFHRCVAALLRAHHKVPF